MSGMRVARPYQTRHAQADSESTDFSRESSIEPQSARQKASRIRSWAGQPDAEKHLNSRGRQAAMGLPVGDEPGRVCGGQTLPIRQKNCQVPRHSQLSEASIRVQYALAVHTRAEARNVATVGDSMGNGAGSPRNRTFRPHSCLSTVRGTTTPTKSGAAGASRMLPAVERVIPFRPAYNNINNNLNNDNINTTNDATNNTDNDRYLSLLPEPKTERSLYGGKKPKPPRFRRKGPQAPAPGCTRRFRGGDALRLPKLHASKGSSTSPPRSDAASPSSAGPGILARIALPYPASSSCEINRALQPISAPGLSYQALLIDKKACFSMEIDRK
jgi:hypothetical protein